MFGDLWLSTLSADLDMDDVHVDVDVDVDNIDINSISSQFSIHSSDLLSPRRSEAGSEGLESAISDTSSGWEPSNFSQTIPHINNKYPSGRDSYLGPSIIFMSGPQVGQIWRRLNPSSSHPGTQRLLDFLETADMESAPIKQLTSGRPVQCGCTPQSGCSSNLYRR